MNALANAIAHGQAHAMSDGSVHAKRSEVKSPDLTSPDLNHCESKPSSFNRHSRNTRGGDAG